MVTKQKFRNIALLYIIFSFSCLAFISNVEAQWSPHEVKIAFRDFVDGLQTDGLTDSQIAPKVKERMAQLVIEASKSGLKLDQIATIVQAAAAGVIRGAFTGSNNLPIYAFALSAGAVSGAATEKLSSANIAQGAVIGSVMEALELGKCDKVEWGELIKTTTCCYPDKNLVKPTALDLRNFRTGCCKKEPTSAETEPLSIGEVETKSPGGEPSQKIHIFIFKSKTGLEKISKEDCCKILGENEETDDSKRKGCCTVNAVWTAAFCGASPPLNKDFDPFQWSSLLENLDAERQSIEDVIKAAEDAVQEFITNSPSF